MTDVAKTAVGAGMMRALEGHARQPLFEDPLAERLLSGWQAAVVRNRALRWAFLAAMDRAGPGFYGAVVCRTRVIDDACREALADGMSQVVILGAGFDTRPYRMPSMRAADVWELDLPRVQQAKRAALARALPAPPTHVTYTPIDLAGQRDALPAPRARTLLLCEAVSLYLPVPAVDSIISYAGSLPSGSRLIFTYLPRDVADNPAYVRWAGRLHWQTAFAPPELAVRLAAAGLTVRADVGAAEHQERLLRPIGRTMEVFDGERIAIADKQ